MNIEQAVYFTRPQGEPDCVGRSPDFPDAWNTRAKQLCLGFGERPGGVACPHAVFVQPLDRKHLAIVRVADLPPDETGQPGGIGFRILAVPRLSYEQLGADPFRIDDAFEPDWRGRLSRLPSLRWNFPPAKMRTTEELAVLLDKEHERTAWLLGSAQVLVDGGKVWLERPAPELSLVRDLWNLLPYSTRAELYPATFTFSNEHRFHLAVAPPAVRPQFEGYVSEDRAGEYPEGRYELGLQTAVESGDQPGLEALLLRRSRRQMIGAGLMLLALVSLVALVSRMPPLLPPEQAVPRAAVAPLAEDIAPFDAVTQREATRRLGDLVRSLGGEGDSVADLDRVLATRLKPKHSLDDVPEQDLLSRQLHLLLWKYGLTDGQTPGLTLDEIFERFSAAVRQEAQ
jgi:hypothetical protein